MSTILKSKVGLSLLLVLFLAACAGQVSQGSAVPSESNEAATYEDPSAYCAAVRTVDSPDARYTGPKLPDSILKDMLAQGIVSANAPADFQKNAVWRCMNGHVWVCHFGANLPCLEKADSSKTPTSDMEDYCKANPASEVIPAAITGRATVYEWKCNAETPAVVRQVLQIDSQGFLADFWYDLTPK